MGREALELAARQGVRIALDDATIAPASALVLSRCNAHIINIDKSVLLEIDGDGRLPPWAEALSVLLKTTAMEVIAEGVETARQLQVLRDAGVRRVQGHYFSPPLRVEPFLQYFRHQAGPAAH
jgi:EAL domain-containing protein (putative c-di-GMP-specific phosphodiesterase class I)